MTKVIKNDYGFYEVADKPTQEELRAYYAEKYYQTAQGSYEKAYSEAEKNYFRAKTEQKHIAAKPHLRLSQDMKPRFLDVGCGEGWSLAYFADIGWECQGLDFSAFGCQQQNPAVFDRVLVGNIYDNLAGLAERSEKYDVILLDNVLEHVLDPLQLLKTMQQLLRDGGTLLVEVPNDFSVLHQLLIHEKYISREFWVVPPDHLSYFGKEGLVRIAEAAGWQAQALVADYPIDWGLLNRATNYVDNPAVGKDCHNARIATENLLHSISPEKTVALYAQLADLGLGRTILAVLTR